MRITLPGGESKTLQVIFCIFSFLIISAVFVINLNCFSGLSSDESAGYEEQRKFAITGIGFVDIN